MRPVVVSILAVASVVTLARAGEGPADLQGRWDLVSVEAEGKDYPLKDNRPRCEIVGDRVRCGGMDLAVLAADPATSPKSIDLRFEPTKRTFEGIYTREGETLKICLN